MKFLIVVLLSVLANNVVARGLENLAVRHGGAANMLTVASSSLIFPVPMIPVLSNHPSQAKPHLKAFEHEMREAIVRRTDILEKYVEFIYNPETDSDSLVTDFYEEMALVASRYVSNYRGLGKARWVWANDTNNAIKLDEDGRKNILRQAMQNWAQLIQRLNTRETYDIHVTDVFDILEGTMDAEDKELTDNLRAFYQIFPLFNVPVLASETDAVKKLLAAKKHSYSNIMIKLELLLMQNSNTINDIDLQQNVHLVDIYNHSKLIEPIQHYYNMGDNVHAHDPKQIEHYIKFDLVNLRDSVVLHALGMQKEWQTTWAQLLENSSLVSVLGDFLQAMDLDWPAFGQLVYPQDERAASQLITNINWKSADIEAIVTALQKYRQTLHDDELIARIDTFIDDLPHLVEKNLLLVEIARLHESDKLSEDDTPQAELEGNSPQAILQDALSQNTRATGRWQYLGTIQLKGAVNWYLSTSVIGAGLVAGGITEEQLQEHVFTASGLDKLQRGEAFTSQEIEAVRQLVSAEKIEALMRSYSGKSKEGIEKRLQLLPLIMQLESFVITLEKNLHTDAAFLKALRELTSNKNTEASKMFMPLALTLQGLHKPQNKKGKHRKKRSTSSELRQVRNNLLKVAKDRLSARKDYLVAGQSQTEDSQQDALREKQKQQQVEQQAQRQAEQRAQRQAQQQAQQELKQRVSSLAKKMGRERLPSNTPLWLRLRALLIYLDIDSKALLQRAAMKDVKAERLAALIAQGAGKIPTNDELDSINKALTQHILSQEKKGFISSKQKNTLLENMEIELEEISTLINLSESWMK